MGSETGIFTDSRDGKDYKTVKIGNQVWIVENLIYKPSSGTYWAYDNDQGNVAEYGYLYDWETAKKGCPLGWHLPTESEFRTLLDNFGGEGEKTGAYNAIILGGISGFSALFGGYYETGFSSFVSKGSDTGFWSSSEKNTDNAWSLGIYGAYKAVRLDITPKNLGFSVRCLQDS